MSHSAIRVSSGPLLDVVDDGVDDGVEVVEVVDDLVVVVVVDLDVEIDLDADPGSDGGHNRPSLFLAATAARLGLRQATRDSLYHTRRGLNRQRNLITPLFTNQDLISCLHLLVNNTLSDKEFSTQLVNKS